jgi:acyl carrier protein
MNENEYTVIRMVAEHFQLKMVEVEPHMDLFDDLGADSLDSVELVLEIEKLFDVEVADEIIDSTRTVQDIITLVNDLS